MGGRRTLPTLLGDEGRVRLDVVVWLSLPDGLMINASIGKPGEATASLAHSLTEGLGKNGMDLGRWERIRLCSEALADEVRPVAGGLPIVVARTPEIDESIDLIEKGFSVDPREASGIMDRSRISERVMRELFEASSFLFAAAPWEDAHDDQVLRLDLEALDVTGAAVSVIGSLGESLGILVFPSLDAYERFLAAIEDSQQGQLPEDIGTRILSLSFEPPPQLPRGLQDEARARGWKVAAPHAYPVAEHRDRRGACVPLEERDVRLLAACARAVTALSLRHPRLFREDRFRPVSESYEGADGIVARLTAPYAAYRCFEDEAPTGSRVGSSRRCAAPGRNDPCWCGSGRKYKRCHLAEDEAAERGHHAQRTDPIHELDSALARRILSAARGRFTPDWPRAKDILPCDAGQLQEPWLAYHAPVDARTAAEWFLEERIGRLDAGERSWIEAQHKAWLSIWKVIEVRRGEGMALEDLLTGERRDVREIKGSSALETHLAILARIVDHEGRSVMCGYHKQPLPPFETEAVVGRVRNRLRLRGLIPRDRLRDVRTGRFLVSCWQEVAEAARARWERPPLLTNTEGHPFLLTTDRFDVAPGSRAEVEARLRALPWIDQADGTGAFVCFTPGSFLDKEGRTIIGRVTVADARLDIETNSVERADALRKRIEEACDGYLTHRVREHCDPLSAKRATSAEAVRGEPPLAARGKADLIRSIKKQHYSGWPDEKLPALGGLTPAAAVRTADGRRKVRALLEDMTFHEESFPESERYDFAILQRRLGLEE